ncbi:hypothetical protein CsSME_00033214 [Camellia sinensis var. sinensis]
MWATLPMILVDRCAILDSFSGHVALLFGDGFDDVASRMVEQYQWFDSVLVMVGMRLRGRGVVPMVEDFERIYELSIIEDEYSTYYSNLCHANCDPYVAVAEGKGCAENKGFEGCGWKKEKEVHKKFSGGQGVMVDKEDHIISEIFRNETFWLPVVEKICKRLEGWKRALLSKGWRIAKTMENLLKDFLWEGKDERKKQTLYHSSIASLASSNLALIAWNFSFSRNLTEREVGDLASLLFLIDHLSLDRNTSDKQVYPWAFSFDPDKWNDISQSDIISAMREVLNYVPLKEDCKMQLTLELSRLKCYHILDNLTLEAVKDVKIQELHRFVDDVSSDESKAEDAVAMLYDFANCIVDELHVLSGLKGDAEAIMFPISHGSFGPCTDELRGVINVADNERRMQCQRFISIQHILFGLSFSRVGDSVRMLNDRSRCSGGLHSKLSMFSIYKLSRIAADRVEYPLLYSKWLLVAGRSRFMHIFMCDKVVRLEHLVLAIFFGKQEDDPIKRVELEYGSSLFFDDNAFDPELVDCEKQRLLLFFGESILHNGGVCDVNSFMFVTSLTMSGIELKAKCNRSCLIAQAASCALKRRIFGSRSLNCL